MTSNQEQTTETSDNSEETVNNQKPIPQPINDTELPPLPKLLPPTKNS